MGGSQAAIYVEEKEMKREKETSILQLVRLDTVETHYASCYWLSLLPCIKY